MKVFLESEYYGYEEFEAEDIEEALKMIKRLYRDATRAFKGDSEERKIGLVVD
jgi:hypothetical protein